MVPDKLVAMCRLFNEKHTFAVGDIVVWKYALKNKRTKGPFVVVHVLDTPLVDHVAEPGSVYFNEPLDIVLGHIDSDGEFLVYYYDSRRFEPAE
jgi:hypothetical protein